MRVGHWPAYVITSDLHSDQASFSLGQAATAFEEGADTAQAAIGYLMQQAPRSGRLIRSYKIRAMHDEDAKGGVAVRYPSLT
jgi:hypothetical protein